MNYWICLTKHIKVHLKKSINYLMLFFALPCGLIAADFGVGNWGMSPAEIKQLETRSNLTPFGQTDYLIYEVSLSGIEKTRIIYQFQNGKLNEGRFLFTPRNKLDVSTALLHYRRIKEMMSGQYGPPNIDQTLSSTPNMMDLSPEAYPNELASDRLILKSSWRSSTAYMKHQLAWNVGKPHHQLHYIPISTPTAEPPSQAF